MYEVKDEVIRNIIGEFESELDNRNYNYSEDALYKIINEWMQRKQNLLSLLSKHPLWNPDKLMIQFDQDYSRKIELEELYVFINYLLRNVTTWNGKSLTDLNCTCDENLRRKNVIFWMRDNIKDQFFNDSMKEQIKKMNSYNENYKLRTNMKSSKAIGKICREEGWDKLKEYNIRYAALCDNLNPIKVKRHTVISLNPLDFLLMSYGDSWESCHYIGDDIYDAGCYSSGTISYMLDECSFVFYTVNADFDGKDIELAEKSQREIFGYNDEVFLQSRLYPQANDCGADAVYDDIRHIVQKIIADCLEKPNLWTVTKDLKTINEVVKSGREATCYPDWHRGCPGSNHVSLSTLKNRTMLPKSIVLGAQPICISCGCRHDNEENISCCESGGEYCTKCGEWISEDECDVRWVDGDPYCSECAVFCYECDDCVCIDDAIEIRGKYYCKDCFGEYASKCDCCGEYDLNEYMIFIEDDKCFCEDCADEETFNCEECYDDYTKENGFYDEETEAWYCKECYEALLKERKESEEEVNEQAV